jgi:aspartate dehydrogenase
MELAFVYNRSQQKLDSFAPHQRLNLLADFREFKPDLIVEASHPVVTREHGADFLSLCNYMPISTSAFVDDDLYPQLLKIASRNNTRLFLPAGALIGGHDLAMRRGQWKHVKITFKKNPENIDFSSASTPSDKTTSAQIICDGPVREVARLFPRNVNTMVTCALLSTGLDACRGVLICDPSLDHAVAEVEAWGHDGSYIRTQKRQPIVGVSGTEMIDSVWYSLQRAARLQIDGFEHV